MQEVRASHAEMQSFLLGVFDKLEQMLEEARAEEALDRQADRQAEHDTLDGQIARLAAITEQLARSVAEQRPSTARRKRP